MESNQNYRIYRNGEHVATVKAAQIDLEIEYHTSLLERDIDGNAIGEVTVEKYDGFVQGAA